MSVGVRNPSFGQRTTREKGKQGQTPGSLGKRFYTAVT